MKDYNSISDRYLDNLDVDVSIGVGILDISKDINNHFVRKKTFDITYWMVNQSLKQDLCTYSGFDYSLKNILNRSIENNNTICVVISQGMMAPKLYRILSKTVEYYKKNPDFFVMGHIMAKEGRYPGLHRQMLIVNLKRWKDLGSPDFEEQGFFWDRKIEYSNYVLSEETLTAEYAPAWIEGTNGTQIVSVVEDGSNWIDIACRNNIRIDNFDFEIRDCKAFLYPYDNADSLEYVWKNLQDHEIVDKIKNYTQRAWIRKLAYQEYIEKDRVYAYNTERLSGEGKRSPGPIDVIFSAAAGFKTMKLLENNGFHEGTKVVYYDWCSASLSFKKHLLSSWNGLDFHKWLLEHDLEYNFSSTYRGNYREFWELEIKKEFETEEKFKMLWDRYSKLEHDFVIIDIVNQPKKLFDEIDKYSGNRVLWTTNIWSTMMLHWNVDIDEIEKKYLEFEKLIPNDLVIYGHDYLANDLYNRVKNSMPSTHPRYRSTYHYINELES